MCILTKVRILGNGLIALRCTPRRTGGTAKQLQISRIGNFSSSLETLNYMGQCVRPGLLEIIEKKGESDTRTAESNGTDEREIRLSSFRFLPEICEDLLYNCRTAGQDILKNKTELSLEIAPEENISANDFKRAM